MSSDKRKMKTAINKMLKTEDLKKLTKRQIKEKLTAQGFNVPKNRDFIRDYIDTSLDKMANKLMKKEGQGSKRSKGASFR